MRKYPIAAAIGAALIIWVSLFQGYRNSVDLAIFAVIGAVAGVVLNLLPRFVTWMVLGAMIPAAVVPVYLPDNWIELESVPAFSFCIIGGIVGLLIGLTVREGARWYQLSLRTLLLLFTLVAICVSPFGRAAVKGRIQERVVRELRMNGAAVSYSADRSPIMEMLFGKDAVQQVTAITWNGDVPIRVGRSATYLNGPPVTDAEVEKLLLFTEIESLGLAGSRLTDLNFLAGFSKLEHLDLRGVSADVAPLKNLKGLKSLDLRGAAVNPDTIEQLRADLPECEIRSG